MVGNDDVLRYQMNLKRMKMTAVDVLQMTEAHPATSGSSRIITRGNGPASDDGWSPG
jgi:hypothetical protein